MIRSLRIVPCILLSLSLAGLSSPRPFCWIELPQDPPSLVAQAGQELSSTLSRMTSRPVPIGQPSGRSPVVELRLLDPASGFSEEEYLIESSDAQRLVISGRTPLAVLHGAYRLLREYGAGFYLDGDAIPNVSPDVFLMPRIRSAPAFAIRGSLPWYNFFNSPTTWDDQDFRFFADQIIRSGQNFIGFHTYDGEPFAAYDYEGKLIGGEPLLTTGDRVWGSYPLPVDEFGYGSGRLFTGTFWGSDAAMAPGSREEKIRSQKALLARGLQYASSRGVKTCLGFEVSGDPTHPEEQRRFKARLTQLLSDYPMLDYVWLWQPEAMSLEGTQPPALRSQAGRLYRDWEEAFSDIGRPSRMWEGMRVAFYGVLGQEIIDAAAPSVRLVLSGWGGDHHLHVSDYFPCWDKVVDKRIIFAALDDIVVSPQVSQYYALPPDRERWAIPWYEFDGDQWFPQANAHVFDATAKDALNKGCQGLLAIHWRTKEVGESQALVAQRAWAPQETLGDFYRDYGIRRFGADQGEELGLVLKDLDALGYRWLGGGGQSECGNFAWCHVGDEARISNLRTLRDRLASLREAMDPPSAPSGASGRADDVLATIDRALLFNEIAGWMVPGGLVAQALSSPPGSEERKKALDVLKGPQFEQMLSLYGQTITSRGEMGVLATVNAKAFFDLRSKAVQLAAGLDADGDPKSLSTPNPDQRFMISDYQLSSLPAGTDMTVRCAASEGGTPARDVTLQVLFQDSKKWAEFPMALKERCVFQATVPGNAVRPGWVRYRIAAKFSEDRVVWPEVRGEGFRQVTVFEPAHLAGRHQALQALQDPSSSVALDASLTEHGTVLLSWPAQPRLRDIEVQSRSAGQADWRSVGETLFRMWEDSLAAPGQKTEYRILDQEGKALGQAEVFTPPAPQPRPAENLTARARGNAVRLRWTGADLSVSGFLVERGDQPEGPFSAINQDELVLPERDEGLGLVDRPGRDGEIFYRVRSIGLDGQTSSVSPVVAARVSDKIPEPVLNLNFETHSLESPLGPIELSGPGEITQVDGRGVLKTDGGWAVPYGEAIAIQDAFTVAIRFRQSEATPMPVLVCQGAWLGPGYFVQILNNQLRFYVSGAGCLDRPIGPTLGVWHTAVCVFDGATLSIFWDGSLLGERPVDGPMTPATCPFFVARYSSVGPEWSFKGEVDFVRLYKAAIEPWMVMRPQQGSVPLIDLGWKDPAERILGQAIQWHQEPRLTETPRGRAVDLSGGLTLPLNDLYAIGDDLTIETSFLLTSVEGMPVLVNQGLWPNEGYMVQILGGRIRFNIGGVGSLDCGPVIQENAWYDIRCCYDQATMQVFLNGDKVGEMRSTQPMMTSLRPLRIGRYEEDSDAYKVQGLMGPVRISGPEP